MKLRTFVTLFVILYNVNAAAAQVTERSTGTSCRAGSIQFTCPEDFKRLPDVDKTTSLFEYENDGTFVYFFVGTPSKTFDFPKVQKAIGKHFSAFTFRWKPIRDIFMMNMRTKYKKTLTAYLGFEGEKLINLTSATFMFKDKPIVLGYAWDTKSPDAADRFAEGKAIGDHGVGCNAIVNTLNSITKEFPGEEQYCYLTGFSSPKD